MKKSFQLLWLLIGGLLLAGGQQQASAQSAEALKSAFIFNFAKFVTWPDGAIAGDQFVVGFLGADEQADTFEKTVSGKNVNGKTFAVKKLGGAAEAAGCQIVFVGDVGKLADVMGAVSGKPVLTVGDTEEFASKGGVIGFISEGSKIRFDLNLAPTGPAGLKIDDKLQKIARNVTGA